MPSLPFNWFDFLFLAALVFGVFRGRKTGALPQVFGLVHWTLTLVICSFLYELPAAFLAENFHKQPDVMALIVYPLEFVVIYFLLWKFVRRRFEKNTEKQELFGNGEYYVAMAAGAGRLFVIMLAVMAWLSGRYVTDEDMQQYKTFCDENFGGIQFPCISSVHHNIFKGSFVGKVARNYLSGVLVHPAPRLFAEEQAEDAVPGGGGRTRFREVNDGSENQGGSEDENSSGKIARDPKQRDARETAESRTVSSTRASSPGAAKSGQATRSQTPSSSGATANVIYHGLTLKGISGSGDRRFATINNELIAEGQSGLVRIEKQKVRVQCLQILEESAIIQLKGETNTIELKFGITTDLRGSVISQKAL